MVRSSDVLKSGRPFFAAFVSGPSAVRKLLNSGANGFAAASSCESLRSAGRNSSRNGLAIDGERSSSLSAVRRVALERRQRAERLGERLAAFGGGVEGALAVDDQAFELVVAAGERVEHDARCCCTSARTAPSWEARMADQPVGVFDERLDRRRSRR